MEPQVSKLEDKLKSLSAKPGVYLFRDAGGDVLYIGKAKSLRPRVRSYFQAAADTLVRAQLDDDERERLTVHVVRESLRAGRLIGDMLLMARLDEGLALEAELMERLFRSKDATEGLTAFVEKREPEFVGS